MKTTIKIYAIAVVLLTLVTTACSKDGETGPIGPQGQQGQDGQDGSNGQDGQNGQDGNANVIYSEWFTVVQEDWDGLGSNKLDYTFDVPELTQEIEDTGTVLIYHRFNGVSRQLPYTYTSGYYIGYTFGPLLVTLEYFHKDDIGIASTADLDFRYVILPSNVAAGKGNRVDFSKMSYEEVMDYFEIPY